MLIIYIMNNFSLIHNDFVQGLGFYKQDFIQNKQHICYFLEIIVIIFIFVNIIKNKYNHILLFTIFYICLLLHAIQIKQFFDIIFYSHYKYLYIISNIFTSYIILLILFIVYILISWKNFKNLKARLIFIILFSSILSIFHIIETFLLLYQNFFNSLLHIFLWKIFSFIIAFLLYNLYIKLISNHFNINEKRVKKHLQNKSFLYFF